MSRSIALAFGGLCAVLLSGACSDSHVTIGLLLRSPQGLLDDATAVSLRVINAEEASCDPATGSVGGSVSSAQTFPLRREGCQGAAGWCGTITLDQDDSSKVFAVEATGAAGVLGVGCTTAVIDQDPLEVNLQIHKYNAPKCCGDGILQAGEQCDLGVPGSGCAGDVGEPGCTGLVADDFVCACDCRSNEILLSIDNPAGAAALTNGPAGSKTDLALAFSGTAGLVGGSLRAVYTDHDTAFTNTPDISIRLLQGQLYPYTAADGLALTGQMRLPDCQNLVTTSGPVREQQTASLAMLDNAVVGVVYSSDEAEPIHPDVYLSLQTGAGCADNPYMDPIQVNYARSDGTLTPDIARGPTGQALIVWLDGGAVQGRIWNGASFEPAAGDIPIGTASATARPRVAGTNTGWIVVYETESNVWLHRVSTTQTVGAREQVNLVGEGVQDQPDVAMLSDGRAVVVWRQAGAIYAQRYDAAGQALSGDQEAPLGITSPPGMTPAVAGVDEGAGSFAVAWAADDGTIWARYLTAASGFAYNSVTGQNDDFPVNFAPSQRSLPAVAVGGAGVVAIGWQDVSPTSPGVWVRGFPLPE